MATVIEKHRRSIRMCGYHYSSCGAYFITICSFERKNIFGEIVDGKMLLNDYGLVVQEHWSAVPDHFPFAELSGHVVMPNHFHGIIFINAEEGEACLAPTMHTAFSTPRAVIKPNSLGAIIAAFKSSVTKRINELRSSPGAPVWQRNYYEHIVRNDEEMFQIQEYIPRFFDSAELKAHKQNSPGQRPGFA
jgi:REP element-mobilizing transposase RayT